MRSFTARVMSIDQRFYDILAILLLGLAANLIIGSGGKEDERWLLGLAFTCALSGGTMMFLRSWRASIETRADAKHLLNNQAAATRSELVAVGLEVPPDINSRADAANNPRRVHIRSEINIYVADGKNSIRIIVTFLFSVLLAIASIGGIIVCLHAPDNKDIPAIIKSTTTTSQKKIVDDLQLLREDIASLTALLSSNSAHTDETIMAKQIESLKAISTLHTEINTLSALLSSNNAHTNENIMAGQIEISKAICDMHTQINTLSASLENLETEATTPPPLSGGTENEQDRKQE